MPNKIFKVPVVWSMMGYVNVEAESAEAALKFARKNVGIFSLPENGAYLEDSFEIDDEGCPIAAGDVYRYEDKCFGVVRWYDDDLANALEGCGYPSSSKNVSLLRDACGSHHFTDGIVAAGWDTINFYIDEIADSLDTYRSQSAKEEE